MSKCVCVCVCDFRQVCVFVERGLGGGFSRCGLLSVCVLSTLPSAKSLPMPLWFYLLYDFLVNFIFFKCAILISLTMPIKGNVFEKKKGKIMSLFPVYVPVYVPYLCDECPSMRRCCTTLCSPSIEMPLEVQRRWIICFFHT